MSVSLTLNDTKIMFDGDTSMPLLWYLRDVRGLTGTKFGCGIAQCGACTVHVDGEPRRSCVTPLSDIDGSVIATIESAASDRIGKAVQAAWVNLDVPQCGYCQSGQIMTAIGLLSQNPSPSDEDIDAAVAGNLCRCGTYPRIRAAIHEAAKALGG